MTLADVSPAWSPGQVDALARVRAWLADPSRGSREPGVFRLFGYAGSGKSTLARHLAASVGGVVRYAAFTGKAALVMHQKGCLGATTIHRLIYLPRVKCERHARDLQQRLRDEQDPDRRRELQAELDLERANLARPSWTLNTESPLREAALLVIDECSMVSEPHGRDLLSFGVPILALGDPAQLPPVAERGYFTDPRQEPDVLLEEVHRQAADSPVLRLATRARQGLPLEHGQYDAEGHPPSSVVHRGELSRARIVDEYDQVICGRNATRRQLNRALREISLPTATGLPPTPIAGDRLICLRNDHELGLLNGSQWRCLGSEDLGEDRLLLSIQEEGGDVATQVEAHAQFFRGEEPDRWDVRRAQCFDFGYAITVHKCVHPSTLVETEVGLSRIADAAPSGRILTSDGFRRYAGKIQRTDGELLRLRTKLGYEIAVTPDHRMMTWTGDAYEIVRADQLSIGSFLRLPIGGAGPGRDTIPADVAEGDVREVRHDVPSEMSAEVAEFLGLFVADGTLFRAGFRLCKRHDDVLIRFADLCRRLFGARPRDVTICGTGGVEISSRHLVRWLLSVGGLAPNQKAIPTCILSASPEQRRAFLRGLFEDGSASRKDRTIEWSTKYEEMSSIVQVMLLGLGLPASRRRWAKADGFVRWSVYLNGDAAIQFGREIGFVCAAKNEIVASYTPGGTKLLVPIARRESFADKSAQTNARAYGYVSGTVARRILDPEDPRLRFLHDKITSVTPEFGPSACVYVPGHGRFVQAGFDGSNSQGSQWRSVCVVDESADFGADARRHLYTAITRASERVTVVR